jgi:HEPN domain-containing protein
MKEETKSWIKYANENLESARVLFDSMLYNPCLQNVQQCFEKALKALLIDHSVVFYKTHSISDLKTTLVNKEIPIEIDDEECEFLDSIYLPSKYPILSVLPDFTPDKVICQTGIQIAEKVIISVEKILS